ncbi:MAG: response regulator transcription factor [Cyanobacteria bacterium P01_C01_bin.120]
MIAQAPIKMDAGVRRQKSLTKTLRSLLIADDNPRYRQALRAFIEFYRHTHSGWFEQIYEVDRGCACVEIAIAEQPDLIMLDLEFLADNESGLDIFDQLKQAGYEGKVAIVSGHDDSQMIFQAMKSGACGYLLKDRLTTQLPNALKAWARDRVYLEDEVTTRFFSVFHHRSRPPADMTDALTNRESEVLKLLVHGASNQEMANRLYITSGTVKAHLTSIFNKLHVSSRTQAIIRAVKTGLVMIEEAEFEGR